MHRIVRSGSIVGVVLLVVGCAAVRQPFAVDEAHPGLQSNAHDELVTLPAPNDQIVAAVYQFRDQTGQYKEQERGSSFSTAVTQGASSILVKALEDSDWFIPIERKGLSNLVKERDIIRSTRTQNNNSGGSLSSLLYAGVLLEGGIIGYDTNVITGGGGLRIGGVGGSGEFREDQVTVYLRAVSSQTGRVLKTVHTTKTVLSQKIDGNAFRYIGTDLLLETEAGITYNEPTLMAVTEAIEASVRSLVVEGIREGVWSLRESSARDSLIHRYEQRKKLAANRDYFDRLLRPENRRGWGIEAGGGGLRYQGDYRRPTLTPFATLAVRRLLASQWALGVRGSFGQIRAQKSFETSLLSTGLDLTYYLLPRDQFTPFLRAEAGVLSQFPHNYRFGETAFATAGAAVGFEYMVSPHMGISTEFGTRVSTSDDIDGATKGRFHDTFWRGGIGITYYLPFL